MNRDILAKLSVFFICLQYTAPQNLSIAQLSKKTYPSYLAFIKHKICLIYSTFSNLTRKLPASYPTYPFEVR